MNTRGADDFVTVVAEFRCEAVGPSSCQKEVSQYCVTATWLETKAADGGAPSDAGVAQAHGCATPVDDASER